jgi:hypothetical protein
MIVDIDIGSAHRSASSDTVTNIDNMKKLKKRNHTDAAGTAEAGLPPPGRGDGVPAAGQTIMSRGRLPTYCETIGVRSPRSVA